MLVLFGAGRSVSLGGVDGVGLLWLITSSISNCGYSLFFFVLFSGRWWSFWES